MTEEESKELAVKIKTLIPEDLHYAIFLGSPVTGMFYTSLKCDCPGCMFEAIGLMLLKHNKMNHICELALLKLPINGSKN